MARILLADDHPVVRQGLRLILSCEPGWDICAEAADGEEAVAAAMLYRPDVAILDIAMPGLSGIEACRRIRATLPDCRIAIVTMHEIDELRDAAIAAGASAYLRKSDAEEHLVLAVRALVHHRSYLLDNFARNLQPF